MIWSIYEVSRRQTLGFEEAGSCFWIMSAGDEVSHFIGFGTNLLEHWCELPCADYVEEFLQQF